MEQHSERSQENKIIFYRQYMPYENLANAIVEQACKEYRRLWYQTIDDVDKQRIIRFFRSQWFSILTALDPEWLIEKLEREADAKREKANKCTKTLAVGRKTLAKRSKYTVRRD